jgi:hypothetical protein
MTKLQSSTLAALVVALAATAGSVSLGVVVSRQQTQLAAAPALAAAQANADNRQLAELREKLATAEKARDAVRADLKKLADKKAMRAREEEDALRGPVRMLWRRLYFQQKYRPLFEQLNLDNATREKFIALLIEDDVAELADTLRTRKTTGEDDAPFEQNEARWTATDKNLLALLGPERHAAFREYITCQFGSFSECPLALADAGCPLTDNEQKWLGHLWYERVSLPAEKGRANDFTIKGDLSPQEEAVLVRASERLSSSQITVLREYFSEEHAYQKALKSARQ